MDPPPLSVSAVVIDSQHIEWDDALPAHGAHEGTPTIHQREHLSQGRGAHTRELEQWTVDAYFMNYIIYENISLLPTHQVSFPEQYPPGFPGIVGARCVRARQRSRLTPQMRHRATKSSGGMLMTGSYTKLKKSAQKKLRGEIKKKRVFEYGNKAYNKVYVMRREYFFIRVNFE